jgi:hypothetical protein
MQDTFHKWAKGEIDSNGFFNAWCSGFRFHNWQEEFGMYLDLTEFREPQLHMGGYYYAKKDGGNKTSYQIWMFIDPETLEMYPVLKCYGYGPFNEMCLI